MEQRKIIHIDMDAFFASVEQRDNPELRGKPIAVGYDGPRGVVSTASYEARPFGVHSAMAIATAKRRCPQLIIVSPHFEKYKAVSRQVDAIFHEYTDLVEPISIDEAFLDVTQNKPGIDLAVDIAREIKKKIHERTGLTASAGISFNKFLAKIASDYRKPDGICTVHPDRALDFIARLPIEDFWGVGPKTAERMHAMGIFNGGQLRKISFSHLRQVFGKAGTIYYNFARGIDNRPVITERERKSVGCEQTFAEDLNQRSKVIIELYHTVLELVERIKRTGFNGRTLTLKVKFHDFTQITRSMTVDRQLLTKDDILPIAKKLMGGIDYEHDAIRLMGLSVSRSAQDDELADSQPRWVEGELFPIVGQDEMDEQRNERYGLRQRLGKP